MSVTSFPLDYVPGPSPVTRDVLEIYGRNYSSSDLLDSFFEQYTKVQKKLGKALGVLLKQPIQLTLQIPQNSSVVVQSGEGMLALWAGLKSCIRPGEKVLAIATGVFGFGFAEMAQQIGFDYNETAKDLKRIEREIKLFQPKLVTIVHCETPSGTLNPIEEIGPIVKAHGALFYVDFVASAIGVPVNVEKCHIDIGLLGSQKCLSLPPDLAILTISDEAWNTIEAVNYYGYDALKPWRFAAEIKYFPYTHNWRAVAALDYVLDKLEDEGFDNVAQRHKKAAEYCRGRIQAMGLELFPKTIEECSPTVTAVKVPTNWTWDELDKALREEGVLFGGSYESLAGVVFRIGHMGSQTLNLEALGKALDKLEAVLSVRR